MDTNRELFDEVAGTYKRETVKLNDKGEPVLRCKVCGREEKKNKAGHSNISYTTGVCIDCLMNWR